MPCGEMISPAPKLLIRLPDASKCRIGSSVGFSRHALLPPHRSAIQMLLPSLSISTALVDPHARPSGSLKKFSIVRYGVGRSLVGRSAPAAAAGTCGACAADIAATPTSAHSSATGPVRVISGTLLRERCYCNGMPRTPTDYEKFVNTEALLACQRPIEGLVNSHELFFQVTHQVMELWMKVIAYELRVAMDEMARNDLPEATLRLGRVREIERVLVDQMAV